MISLCGTVNIGSLKKNILLAFSHLLFVANASAQEVVPFPYVPGKYAVISKSGNKFITSKYSSISKFSMGLARVSFEKKYGFINENGEEVIAPDYDRAMDFAKFGNAGIGYANVRINDKWGLIDLTGKQVLAATYEYPLVIDDFVDGYILTTNMYPGSGGGNKQLFGLLDKNFKEVYPIKFSSVRAAGGWGYNLVATGFEEKMFGLIDSHSTQILACEYDDIKLLSGTLITAGLGNNYIIVNSKGIPVTSNKYDYVFGIDDGMIMVEKNKKRGFLDSAGNEVVACRYDDAFSFEHGKAQVRIGGRSFFIDKKGNDLGTKGINTVIGSIVGKWKLSKIGMENKFELDVASQKMTSATIGEKDQNELKAVFNESLNTLTLNADQTYEAIFLSHKTEGIWKLKATAWSNLKPGETGYELSFSIVDAEMDVVYSSEANISYSSSRITKKAFPVLEITYDLPDDETTVSEGEDIFDAYMKAASKKSQALYYVFEGPEQHTKSIAAEPVKNIESNTPKGTTTEISPQVTSPSQTLETTSSFEWIGNFHEGLAPVYRYKNENMDEEWGYINQQGRLAIPLKFVRVGDFGNGLAPVEVNSKWGFIDKTGKVKFPSKWYWAGPFKNGLALVATGDKTFYSADKYGYIDTSGKMVIPLMYTGGSDFTEGLAAVLLNHKMGYIDKAGNTVIPFIYDWALPFKEGYAKVMVNNLFGFIDKNGNPATGFIYKDVRDFSEGLALTLLNGKYGYIDTHGQTVIPQKYDMAYSFSNGLALVEVKRKYGYINAIGEVVFDIKYDNLSGFHDGLALYKLNGLTGFLDRAGKEMTNTRYDDAGVFSDGLAKVKVGAKWGYINTKGELVINTKYDDASEFIGGLAYVTINGKGFTIDKSGKVKAVKNRR